MIYTKDFLKKANIGDYTYGTPTVYLPLEEKITIGKFCSIADAVMFLFLTNHNLDTITTYPFDSLTSEGWPQVQHVTNKEAYKPITIGNDVWIGRSSQIFHGSIIEDGCIIGAHSVVRGYVPAYSICIGNPAQVIKKRFSEEKIQLLLKIKWWNWPIEIIKENLQVIFNSDINQLEEVYTLHFS